MIIPTFALALTIFYMVSNNIWVTFAAIILLMILGNAVKTYYAAFQLAPQSSYIELPGVYEQATGGLSRRHMVPPILPLVIPQFTIMVPFFVFYETSLAFVEVMQPVLPTWGENRPRCAVCRSVLWMTITGLYSRPLQISITGLAFTMLGTRFEYCLNPKEEIY